MRYKIKIKFSLNQMSLTLLHKTRKILKSHLFTTKENKII